MLAWARTSPLSTSCKLFVHAKLVGVGVGIAVGKGVGVGVGHCEGAGLGGVDGVGVGIAVGTADGLETGTAVGADDGAAVGADEGVLVGIPDGAAVGNDEGDGLGGVDGAGLGGAVGVAVGAGVGMKVSTSTESAVADDMPRRRSWRAVNAASVSSSSRSLASSRRDANICKAAVNSPVETDSTMMLSTCDCTEAPDPRPYLLAMMTRGTVTSATKVAPASSPA